MRRAELDHLLRSAGAVTGRTELWVIGSQAILATFDHTELPNEATRSVEADFAVPDDPDGVLTDDIDGVLGEASPFYEMHGIYADGVGFDTARLPAQWSERVVPYSNANTGGVTGLCLERHDLCVSKLLANRQKDLEFCRALLDTKHVDARVINERLLETDAQPDEVTRISRFLERWSTNL